MSTPHVWVVRRRKRRPEEIQTFFFFLLSEQKHGEQRKQYEQSSWVLSPHDSFCCLSARVIQATAHYSFSTCTQTQISNFQLPFRLRMEARGVYPHRSGGRTEGSALYICQDAKQFSLKCFADLFHDFKRYFALCRGEENGSFWKRLRNRQLKEGKRNVHAVISRQFL